MVRSVRIVRNVEFARLFDAFFITAITTILVIRFFLKIFGYPQIGNKTLHIAHLLPGALLMLVAILVLLAAVNRAARAFAAVVAGIGFGLVWDELGKFITKDNNYFFSATPGLIYLTFVILYLVVRYSAQRRLTQDDYIANVLDLLKDASIKDLDEREYLHARELLSHVSPRHILYEPTKEMLERVRPAPNRRPSLLDDIINGFKWPLLALNRRPFFGRLTVMIAILYGAASVVAAIAFLAAANVSNTQHLAAILRGDESDWVGGASGLLSAGCIAVATNKYRHGRIRQAYRFFELGLLVNIFLGQVVLFFKSEGVALAWLAITLFLLVNLELLAEESAVRRRHQPSVKVPV